MSDNILNHLPYCEGVPGITVQGKTKDGVTSESHQIDLDKAVTFAMAEIAVRYTFADDWKAVAEAARKAAPEGAKAEEIAALEEAAIFDAVRDKIAVLVCRTINTDARTKAARKAADDADATKAARKAAKDADDEIAKAMLDAKAAILAARKAKAEGAPQGAPEGAPKADATPKAEGAPRKGGRK